MKTNQAGLKLIEDFEGLALRAYQTKLAPGKYDVPTIGYGHTTAAGPPAVAMGMVITQAEAEQILANDLARVENSVSQMVRVPLTSNQNSALVSFVYNLGEGNFASSTLLKRLNSGDYDVGNEFLKWNKAQGVVLAGLVRRREAEKALWESGATYPAPTPTWSPQPSQPQQKGILEYIVDFIYWIIGKVK